MYLVDVFSMPAAQEKGLVVVELFSGTTTTVVNEATTKA
jgi:hypothetical protein